LKFTQNIEEEVRHEAYEEAKEGIGHFYDLFNGGNGTRIFGVDRDSFSGGSIQSALFLSLVSSPSPRHLFGKVCPTC
jgi:hypothetical protein